MMKAHIGQSTPVHDAGRSVGQEPTYLDQAQSCKPIAMNNRNKGQPYDEYE